MQCLPLFLLVQLRTSGNNYKSVCKAVKKRQYIVCNWVDACSFINDEHQNYVATGNQPNEAKVTSHTAYVRRSLILYFNKVHGSV